MTNHLKSLSVVRLDRVTKEYGFNGRLTCAVRDVTLYALTGELVLLLGPSGSGKTTLLTLTAGLVSASSGVVRLFERRIEEFSGRDLQRLRAERMGFIFQNFLLVDSLTALDNIALVRRFAPTRDERPELAAWRIMERLGIDHLAKKFPPTLSQGEKQRIAVARAIVNSAELILADEPTASLESSQGLEIIRLLHDLARQEHCCVVVASHDVRIADFADRKIQLRDGMICSEERAA